MAEARQDADSRTEAPRSARGFSFELREQAGRLELHAPHHPRYGAICADWNTLEIARRIAGGRKQLLARALELHKYPRAQLLDATAGLGRDGYTLAALGAQVDLCERQPLLQALLADALRRLQTTEIAQRIQLLKQDALTLLQSGQHWDAIYLDPMYPDHGKDAAPKKEMQFLRELTGGDEDSAGLLAPALNAARRRVAVKRPLKAPWLAQREPSFSLRGTQARYDVYLITT